MVTQMLEDAGLRVVASRRIRMTREQAEGFYAVHKERPFYPNLVDFMSSGPVVAIALEGKDAITVVRTLVGKTNAREAAPGTIRGDLGMSFSNNLVHASDGEDTAKFELGLWFSDSAELSDWTPSDLEWRYSVKEELA